MIRWIRRLVAIALFGLAAWWAVRALVEQLDRDLAEPGRYPNEWGVRMRPLTSTETAAAIDREAELTG